MLKLNVKYIAHRFQKGELFIRFNLELAQKLSYKL